jgi:hypothetical protein
MRLTLGNFVCTFNTNLLINKLLIFIAIIWYHCTVGRQLVQTCMEPNGLNNLKLQSVYRRNGYILRWRENL